MVVQADWKPMLDNAVQVDGEVGSATALAWFRNLNALHEAMMGVSCPNSSAGVLAYEGHDHGVRGGAPISHGMILSQWSCNSTTTPIFWYRPYASKLPPQTYGGIGETVLIALLRMPVNAGVSYEIGASWEVSILYTLEHTEVQIGGLGPNSTLVGGMTLPITAPDAVAGSPDDLMYARWASFAIPAGADDGRYNYTLAMAGKWVDPDDVPELKVYAVLVRETREASAPTIGNLLPPPTNATTNDTCYAHFDVLEEGLCAAQYWLDADLWFRLTAASNALYEVVLDRRCQGALTQQIQGHDHNPTGQGGAPVAMGTQFNFGNSGRHYYGNPAYPADPAFIPAHGAWFLPLATGVWTFCDAGAAPQRSSGVAGGVVLSGCFRFPVSAGFTTPLGGTPPCLAAFVELVEIGSAGSQVIGQWYNLTANMRSSAQTINTRGRTTYWNDVPCVGGVWNEVVLELQLVAPAGAINVRLYGGAIWEVPVLGRRTSALAPTVTTQIPATAGSTVLGTRIIIP